MKNTIATPRYVVMKRLKQWNKCSQWTVMPHGRYTARIGEWMKLKWRISKCEVKKSSLSVYHYIVCFLSIVKNNIFMAKFIDPKILETAELFKTDNENLIKFLDDLFLVWWGSCEKLHQFLTVSNSVHPSIKFTMSHTIQSDTTTTCDCPKSSTIPFLDTSC